MNCSMPGFPVLHYLPEFAQTHVHCVVMPSNYLILCCPLLLLPSVYPSLRVFSNELALCSKWPKYWSFSFSISHSKEYSGLISFRIDWFNLLAVQGTLKSLLQHHNLKASIWCSPFLVQFSHPCMTTGKTIALTTWTFVSNVNNVSKVMFVIAFLPRSKCFSILWLQSLWTVILEPKEIKSATGSTFLHLFVMKWWGWFPWS